MSNTISPELEKKLADLEAENKQLRGTLSTGNPTPAEFDRSLSAEDAQAAAEGRAIGQKYVETQRKMRGLK